MQLAPFALVPGQQDSAVSKVATFGKLKVWYSYGDPIAFKMGDEPMITMDYRAATAQHDNNSRKKSVRKHCQSFNIYPHKRVSGKRFKGSIR